MTTIANSGPAVDTSAGTEQTLQGMTGLSALLNRFGTGRVVLMAGAVVSTLFALSDEDGPVLCPFRRCTGGYCPGCGMTRSSGRLVRGDVIGSWQQHPYLVLGLAQAAVVAALWRFGSGSLRAGIRAHGKRLLVANLALLIGIWVVRLFDGSIPVPFAA